MICVEWWCFEAIILLAGRLPQPEVAIDIVGICVNIATTTFMFPFGLAGRRSYGSPPLAGIHTSAMLLRCACLQHL